MSEQTLPPRKNPPLSLLVGVFFGSLLLTGAIIFVVVSIFIDSPEPVTFYDAAQAVAANGTDGVREINPPRDVADFTLTAHTGEPMSLSDLRGKYVVLYFGYTHCPDVCPLTFIDYKQVNEALGEDAQNVAFLFVSVDGERDTPEKLARYFEMRQIDDFMIGMQGQESILQPIAPDYGLFYEAQPVQDNGYYAVDHTASTFLIDPEGRLARIFAFGVEPEIITETIQDLL